MMTDDTKIIKNNECRLAFKNYLLKFILIRLLLYCRWRGDVLRGLHHETFGEGDYVRRLGCSADGVRVYKEEAAKRTAIRTVEG